MNSKRWHSNRQRQRTRFNRRLVECKLIVLHPATTALAYLVTDEKQSWHVPISQVTIKDDSTVIMPKWLALAKGIKIEREW